MSKKPSPAMTPLGQAREEYDQLVDVFMKILNPEFALKLRKAAATLRLETERAADERGIPADLREIDKHLMPSIRQYQEQVARLGESASPLYARHILRKILELYGPKRTP